MPQGRAIEFTHRKMLSDQEQDSVTICLFCKENESGFDASILEREKEKCMLIQEKLANAAIARGQKPPQVKVSLLLVPDWNKPNNSYESIEYDAKQLKFMQKAEEIFSSSKMKIEDFYYDAGLSNEQKAYMHNLRALGSTIDIMKMHAAISSVGNHLQLDSNTVCYDFDALYEATFGSAQGDTFNASFYDTDYVTVHSKVMYTTRDSEFKKILGARLQEYCRKHQDDISDKAPARNSIYKEVFSCVANELGFNNQCVDHSDSWKFYPADLENGRLFRLTRLIGLAVNMSWASKDRNDAKAIVKPQFESVNVGDGIVDFAVFFSIIKKYTAYLSRHKIKDDTLDAYAYKNFLSLSNSKLEMEVLAKFYNHNKTSPSLSDIANLFPNTKQGNIITQALFGCSVKDLHREPKKYTAKIIEPKEIANLVGAIIAEHDKILPVIQLKSNAAKDNQNHI